MQSPEQVLTRCRDRIAEVQEIKDRTGLLAVTQILVGLAYPNRRFFDFFGGAKVMIDSPALDEVKQILREQYSAEARLDECQRLAKTVLEARFGSVPPKVLAKLTGIGELSRLESLVGLAATCSDLASFATNL